MMLRRISGLAPLALLLALAGCGQELTAGGQREGEVSAVLIDDPGAPAPNRSPTRSGASFSTSRARIPTGTVNVQATVTLVSERGGAQELVTQAGGGTVDLGSTSKTLLARADISSIRYTLARVEFTRVQANVTGGLLVGGLDLTGAVSVALPQPVVVEKAIDLTVVEEGHHELEIDLNAEKWLVAIDPLTRTVPSAAFRTAVTMEVRQ